MAQYCEWNLMSTDMLHCWHIHSYIPLCTVKNISYLIMCTLHRAIAIKESLWVLKGISALLTVGNNENIGVNDRNIYVMSSYQCFMVLWPDCINDIYVDTNTCTAGILLPLSLLVLCCPCTDELVRDWRSASVVQLEKVSVQCDAGLWFTIKLML